MSLFVPGLLRPCCKLLGLPQRISESLPEILFTRRLHARADGVPILREIFEQLLPYIEVAEALPIGNCNEAEVNLKQVGV